MGQTVNLLAYAFGGSNPSLPTFKKSVPVGGCKTSVRRMPHDGYITRFLNLGAEDEAQTRDP